MSCVSGNDFDKGKQILEGHGFKNIKNTGWSPMCCGDDSFRTGFTALTHDSVAVSGCFCSTIFKGITIKFN